MSPDGRRPPPPDLPHLPDLPGAISAGLRALADLTQPPRDLISGDLERMLRSVAARYVTAPGRSGRGDPPDPAEIAAAAVRSACAHLSAQSPVDAYLALRAANDALPHELRHGRRPADERVTEEPEAAGAEQRAEKVAQSQRRVLGDRARIEQAMGVLAQVHGISVRDALRLLRDAAERHHYVLAELAADVVAGRVDVAALVPASFPASFPRSAAVRGAG